MNYSRKTIAKNAGVMMVSQIITWGLAILLTVFLPRYLGPEAIGKYQLASSLWAVLSILISFGMDTFLTKEIARQPDKADELLTTSMVLRFILFGLSFALMSIYVQLAGYSKETIEVINIIAFSTLIWQITGAWGAVLQGIERMEYISISDIVGKFFATGVSIIALLLGYKVAVIAWINVLAAVVSLMIQFYGLRKARGFTFQIRPDLFVGMLKSSFSYLMVSGFLVAYNQVDVIIISLLVDEKQIGLYSAASRLFGTFLFIPTVLITSLFPVFSRIHKNDPDALPRILNKSIDLLLLLGVPIGLGLCAVASPIIVLLFGADFSGAGPILAVMGIVLISTYLNSLLGRFFVSIDKQKQWTWVMAGAVVITIPLDLVLVPICQRVYGIGALGGSFSYLITEGLMMLIGFYLLPKGILGWRNVWFALRTSLAGVIMAAVAWAMRDLFILLPILTGGLVYLSIILLLKVITQEDRILIQGLVQSILSRVGLKKLESIS